MKGLLRKNRLTIIIILLFSCLILFIYYKFAPYQSLMPPTLSNLVGSSIKPITSTTQTNINFPVRLKIPSIGINASIEYVGMTPDGVMGVPKNPKNVAWFNLGTLPGSIGSAVIAGHLDDKNGRSAVFKDLDKLNQGDKLFIEGKQGKIFTFIVREKRIYASDAYVPEVFSSNNGVHLNLITCVGSWDKLKRSYTQRLVVFSDIE